MDGEGWCRDDELEGEDGAKTTKWMGKSKCSDDEMDGEYGAELTKWMGKDGAEMTDGEGG
eukprot:5071019-Pleurochrysis_carterae.AAC.1